MILLALLAFNLQGVAAPMFPGCTHPAPEQATHEMAVEMDSHAHHNLHADAATEPSQLNCGMDCDCSGACFHACQLSVTLPVYAVTQPQFESLLLSTRSGAPHHAYSHPLLRPPSTL